jgi:hypothetical protein
VAMMLTDAYPPTPRRDEQTGVRIRIQNGSTLHQVAQTAGSGDFLPKFLPEEATQRSWVRFPSPALWEFPLYNSVLIYCSSSGFCQTE